MCQSDETAPFGRDDFPRGVARGEAVFEGSPAWAFLRKASAFPALRSLTISTAIRDVLGKEAQKVLQLGPYTRGATP